VVFGVLHVDNLTGKVNRGISAVIIVNAPPPKVKVAPLLKNIAVIHIAI
jgi:hypothetical protein